jgi:hypothetical protein
LLVVVRGEFAVPAGVNEGEGDPDEALGIGGADVVAVVDVGVVDDVLVLLPDDVEPEPEVLDDLTLDRDGSSM